MTVLLYKNKKIHIFFKMTKLRSAWCTSRMKPCALKEVKGTGFTDTDALCASDLSREQVASSKMLEKKESWGEKYSTLCFFLYHEINNYLQQEHR